MVTMACSVMVDAITCLLVARSCEAPCPTGTLEAMVATADAVLTRSTRAPRSSMTQIAPAGETATSRRPSTPGTRDSPSAVSAGPCTA